jgi:hypothetical protein
MTKDYSQLWESLGINLEKHDGLLTVLSDAYKNIYLSQENRPQGMKYFDFVISEVHGLRIEELYEAKKNKRRLLEPFVYMFLKSLFLLLMAFLWDYVQAQK